MRPFPVVVAVLTAAVVVVTLVDPGHWFGDNAVVVVVASLATAVIAFNWWELWSTRHER
jgi:hypothetical protein